MGRAISTDIFVSYGGADRAFAEALARALRDGGADVRVPTPERADGDAEGDIRARPTFLVVLSPASLASPAVRAECALAYTLHAREPGRRFLPVTAPGYGPYGATEAIAQLLRRLDLAPRAGISLPPPPARFDDLAPLLAQAQSLAVQLFSPDALTGARQLYERATRLTPDDVAAWTGLGDMCALLQRDTEALAAFERALVLTPRSADLWCDVATMRARLGDQAGALAAYERALALDPDSPRAIEQRGRALVALGRAGEAVAAYDAALARQPETAALWHARGNALQVMERHVEAIAAFERALSLWPHFSCAWRDMAAALRALGRHAEAYDAERHDATGRAS